MNIEFAIVRPTTPTQQIINHDGHHKDNIVAVKAAASFMEAAIVTAFNHTPAGMATALTDIYVSEGLQKIVSGMTIAELVEKEIFMPVCAMERLVAYVAESFKSKMNNLQENIIPQTDISGLVAFLSAIDTYTVYSGKTIKPELEKTPHMDYVVSMFEFKDWAPDLSLVIKSCLIPKLQDLRPMSEG